jgi:hypothetical protein
MTFLLSGTSLPFINVLNNMGTMRSATIAEPIIVNVFVRTSGEKSFCSCPVRNRIGKNEMRVTRIEKNTALPIVRDDFSMMLIRCSSDSSLVFPIRSFSITNPIEV